MNDTPKSNTEQEKAIKKNTAKKTYHPPQLEVYGNLDRLTKGGGGIKNEPGGPATPNTKF